MIISSALCDQGYEYAMTSFAWFYLLQYKLQLIILVQFVLNKCVIKVRFMPIFGSVFISYQYKDFLSTTLSFKLRIESILC